MPGADDVSRPALVLRAPMGGATRHRVAITLVILACATGAACRESSRDPEMSSETPEIMQQIVREMGTLLPLSVQDGELADPANRKRVARSLETLSRNADILELHAAREDEQMQFLARSMARDARGVQRAYREQRFERAGFLLQRITENCVVCHTRLPGDAASPISQGFLEQDQFDELALEPRATLQIATRRFDSALDTLEELLASPRGAVTLLGPLTDYLVVSIRVKGDYERPIPKLERFAERPDLWTRLRREVDFWVDVLPGLQARAAGPPDLATARALLTEGHDMVEFGADRRWLAHLVVASAILQNYIDSHSTPDARLAEAYYLLGITEARIGRNYWVTPAPFLLETSIRMAPGESFAHDAFALLEEELLMSYEGSDYEEIPPEERRVLDELQTLIARPQVAD
jgi:hypothetical protein